MESRPKRYSLLADAIRALRRNGIQRPMGVDYIPSPSVLDKKFDKFRLVEFLASSFGRRKKKK